MFGGAGADDLVSTIHEFLAWTCLKEHDYQELKAVAQIQDFEVLAPASQDEQKAVSDLGAVGESQDGHPEAITGAAGADHGSCLSQLWISHLSEPRPPITVLAVTMSMDDARGPAVSAGWVSER